MVTDAARKYDSGDRDLRLEASATKVFGTEMVSRVVDRALQLYGGMGFSKELPIEYIYRNSRFLRVLEGASEIHRVQIANLYTGRKR
jgi:(R)-benzylsuccinyl-CoA dehydrogenase